MRASFLCPENFFTRISCRSIVDPGKYMKIGLCHKIKALHISIFLFFGRNKVIYRDFYVSSYLIGGLSLFPEIRLFSGKEETYQISGGGNGMPVSLLEIEKVNFMSILHLRDGSGYREHWHQTAKARIYSAPLLSLVLFPFVGSVFCRLLEIN